MIVHVWKQSFWFRGTWSTGQWHCAPQSADVCLTALQVQKATLGWSVQYKISIIQGKKTKTNHTIHYLFTDAYHLAIHLCTVNRYEDVKHSPRCLSSIQITQSAEKQKVCKPKQLWLNFKCTRYRIHSTRILMLLKRKKDKPIGSGRRYRFFPAAPWWRCQRHSDGDRAFNTSHM